MKIARKRTFRIEAGNGLAEQTAAGQHSIAAEAAT